MSQLYHQKYSSMNNENQNSDVSEEIINDTFEESPEQARVQLANTLEIQHGFFNKSEEVCENTYDFAFHTLYSGFLEKKTRNVSFSRKFFVLTPYRLLYYEDQQCCFLNGCFNIAALEPSGLSRGGLAIRLQFKTVQITLRADCELEAEMWYLHIRKARESLPQKNHLHIYIDFEAKFWKELKISLPQLQNYAESLDLILFKSKHIGASLQRFFTVSDYDHIGVVFRNDCGNMYLLHTTSSSGVNIVRWNRFSEYGLGRLFQKVGFRKLMIKREPDIMERVEKCVENLVGKKYQISLAKIFRQTTGEDQREDNHNRTFFCSELVAELYRKIDLLPKKRSACSYWPKDFSKHLPLNKGRLSDLMTVQLN